MSTTASNFMRARPPTLRIATVAAVLLASGGTQAAVHCVSTTQGLVLAIGQSAASAASDEIRLVRGTYTLEDDISVVVKGGLALRGGWTAGCTGTPGNPALTVITSSEPRSASLDLELLTGDYRIEQLTFSAMGTVSLRDKTASGYSGDGSIRILRNRLISNGGGLFVFAKFKDTRIENNLIVGSRSSPSNSYATYRNLNVNVNTYNTPRPISVDVLFNTLIGSRYGLRLSELGPATTRMWVQNNIVWGADDYDIHLDAPDVVASNNIWKTYDWSSAGWFDVAVNIIDEAPMLDLDYAPRAGSPALDAGTDFIYEGLPDSDNRGWSRAMGDGPDIGAFEKLIWTIAPTP